MVITPLYDVSIQVVDLQKFEVVEREPMWSNIKSSQVALHVGEIGPKKAALLENIFELPADAEQQDYNVFISARNGDVSQLMRFRRMSGTWKCAFRVEKRNEAGESALLTEQIPPDFPGYAKGRLPW